MAINKNDFKNAFREVVSSEFAHIPTDENSIDFTFSECFNKRMAKLIKSQKKAYYSLINTAYKRVAIICIIILALLTTACSVKVIREPIVNFFTEVYESFTRYFFEGDTANTITKEYSLKVLPDGFKQTNKTQSDILIITEYQNEHGDIIEFTQSSTKRVEHTFDNEKANVYTEMLNNLEVKIYDSYDTKQAVWIKDEYSFNLICYGDISIEAIKHLIENME